MPAGDAKAMRDQRSRWRLATAAAVAVAAVAVVDSADAIYARLADELSLDGTRSLSVGLSDIGFRPARVDIVCLWEEERPDYRFAVRFLGGGESGVDADAKTVLVRLDGGTVRELPGEAVDSGKDGLAFEVRSQGLLDALMEVKDELTYGWRKPSGVEQHRIAVVPSSASARLEAFKARCLHPGDTTSSGHESSGLTSLSSEDGDLVLSQSQTVLDYRVKLRCVTDEWLKDGKLFRKGDLAVTLDLGRVARARPAGRVRATFVFDDGPPKMSYCC